MKSHPPLSSDRPSGPRFDWHRLLPIVLSQAVGLLCGIAGVKITSQLIAPGDYGAYGLFLSCAPLGMWVVHAGLLKFVSRHWVTSVDRAALRHEVLRAGLRTLPWLALLTFGAGLVLLPSSVGLVGGGLLFVAATLLSVGALGQLSLQALRAHWADFGVSAAGSLTRTFLPPLVYAALSPTLPALFVGYVGHTLVVAWLGTWFARRGRGTLGAGAEAGGKPAVLAQTQSGAVRSLPASPSPAPRQLEAVYEGPLFVALAVASWALTAVNRWIVAGFFGAEAAGFFTLAANLTIIVASMPGTILLQYAQPGLFAAPVATLDERRALARRVDRLALAYTVVAVVGVGLLHVFAPVLVGPFIAERYRASLPFILGAGGFGIAVGGAQFFHVLLLAGKRERGCGPVDLTTAAVLIAGGLVTASLDLRWFHYWLMCSAALPWLLTRPLARRCLLAEPGLT